MYYICPYMFFVYLQPNPLLNHKCKTHQIWASLVFIYFCPKKLGTRNSKVWMLLNCYWNQNCTKIVLQLINWLNPSWSDQINKNIHPRKLRVDGGASYPAQGSDLESCLMASWPAGSAEGEIRGEGSRGGGLVAVPWVRSGGFACRKEGHKYR